MSPVTPWLPARPIRNHNPGDLRPRAEQPEWPGQDQVDNGEGGPFAIFVTNADGWAGLALWCLDARYLRGMKTAGEMVRVFAPSSENDTASYAAGVEGRIGAGVLDLSDTAVLEALCRAIAHWEDSAAAWPEAEVAGGMRLATAHWPAFRAARLAPRPATVEPGPTTAQLNQDELTKIQDQSS